MTRLACLSLTVAALALGAATAASAQRPAAATASAPAHHAAPGGLCALDLVDAYGSRHLIASAAPGVAGAWSLEARAPGFRLDQSGPVNPSLQVQELSRVTLDARLRPAVTRGAAGLRGAVPGPDARSLSAVLTVRDARGRVICRATPQLRQDY
jgi:hypothetical protein